MMEKYTDKKILDSWHKNVNPWVDAIRNNEIESRLLVTNQAIVNAILEQKPASFLDIGCGEGWLVREINKAGVDTLGIDAVPKLIEYAQTKGDERYKTLSYEEMSFNKIKETFDVLACNFSLLGYESVLNVFKEAPRLLKIGGSLIIQTIHPVTGCGDLPYEDGWREGSWAGFSDNFTEPAPWYYRTMETWQRLFSDNGFKPCRIIEPLHPKTNTPVSVIFKGEHPE